MEFLSPIFVPKPLAPINDQNLKKGRPVFLFKLVFEIRFSDALLATEVIFLLYSILSGITYEYRPSFRWEHCSFKNTFCAEPLGRFLNHRSEKIKTVRSDLEQFHSECTFSLYLVQMKVCNGKFLLKWFHW